MVKVLNKAGTLTALGAAMKQAQGNEIEVWFAADGKKAVPYAVTNGQQSEAVEFGSTTARYVGVGLIEVQGQYDYLVSNSFAPCLPVVVFDGNQTYLAHSWANSAYNQLHKRADLKNAYVLIVAKRPRIKKDSAATFLPDCLRKAGFRNIGIAAVNTDDVTGVIVHGQTKTVLVYSEE